MKVICFGDSNTYGYDPRSYFGDRYVPQNRWVDLLTEKTGWIICNKGLNGRTIPRNVIEFPKETQLLIIMLGTNDLLQGYNVAEISRQMKDFLLSLSISRRKILLISPPALQRGEWVADDKMIETSRQLSLAYESVAKVLGVCFVRTDDWQIPMCYDGVHFTEDGHRRFAEGLFEFLIKEDLLCLK